MGPTESWLKRKRQASDACRFFCCHVFSCRSSDDSLQLLAGDRAIEREVGVQIPGMKRPRHLLGQDAQVELAKS